MKAPIAILSLLHQQPGREGSPSRQFHGEPVLAWALKRLSHATRVGASVVLCWDDQAEAAGAIAIPAGATLACKGPPAFAGTGGQHFGRSSLVGRLARRAVGRVHL